MPKRTQRHAKPDLIAPVTAATIRDPEALRRRRRRRWIFIAVVLIAAPIAEVIAYQFRAISISIVNQTEGTVRALQVEYGPTEAKMRGPKVEPAGGKFDQAELAAGKVVTRIIRPNFSFSMADFSSYRTTIRFESAEGTLFRHNIRISSIDYSSRETYTIRPGPPGPTGLPLTLDHTTEPGFPIGEILSFFRRLGLR